MRVKEEKTKHISEANRGKHLCHRCHGAGFLMSMVNKPSVIDPEEMTWISEAYRCSCPNADTIDPEFPRIDSTTLSGMTQDQLDEAYQLGRWGAEETRKQMEKGAPYVYSLLHPRQREQYRKWAEANGLSVGLPEKKILPDMPDAKVIE